MLITSCACRLLPKCSTNGIDAAVRFVPRTTLRQCFQRAFRRSTNERIDKTFTPAKSVIKESSTINVGFKDLGRPIAFTITVAAGSFVTCSIWQHERHMRQMPWRTNQWMDNSSQRVGEIRRRFNAYWQSTTLGQRAMWTICAINFAVLPLFRVPALSRTMIKYFTASPYNKAKCLPMLLSVFGHYSMIHVGMNMFVLYSFSSTVADGLMGMEQFVGFYLSAGVVGSLAGYAFKIASKSRSPSLGASGAILGLLGYTCCKIPDAQLSIVFLPMFTFSAANALIGLLAFDAIGLIIGWKTFDHAAHLGGTLFGVWYATYGEKIWAKYRHVVVRQWIKSTGRT